MCVCWCHLCCCNMSNHLFVNLQDLEYWGDNLRHSTAMSHFVSTNHYNTCSQTRLWLWIPIPRAAVQVRTSADHQVRSFLLITINELFSFLSQRKYLISVHWLILLQWTKEMCFYFKWILLKKLFCDNWELSLSGNHNTNKSTRQQQGTVERRRTRCSVCFVYRTGRGGACGFSR